jgi:transposase InsO family protein
MDAGGRDGCCHGCCHGLRRVCVHKQRYNLGVAASIEAFYNRQRRHSTLGMLSPLANEELRLSPLGG